MRALSSAPWDEVWEHCGSEPFEARWRVVERRVDVLAVVAVECGHRSSLDRRAQKRLGRALRAVALKPLRELRHEVVAQRNPAIHIW